MSFKRKEIRAILDDEKTSIDEKLDLLIKSHSESLDALQDEKDTIQKDLEGAKSWEEKYNALQADFNNYKDAQTQKEDRKAKETAYRKLLQSNNISDKRIDSIIRITDFTDLKLNKDGKFKDEEKLEESIKSDWSEFIPNTSTKGADVSNPPSGNKNTMTKEDILKITDFAKQQEAIKANPQLFTK